MIDAAENEQNTYDAWVRAMKDLAVTRKALKDIAEGNVPNGLLEAAPQCETKEAARATFQESMNVWMQQTARAAYDATSAKSE